MTGRSRRESNGLAEGVAGESADRRASVLEPAPENVVSGPVDGTRGGGDTGVEVGERPAAVVGPGKAISGFRDVDTEGDAPLDGTDVRLDEGSADSEDSFENRSLVDSP